MRVTIVGAGNMGRGIGTRLAAGGNEVELVDQNPEDSRTLAEELGEGATSNRSVTGEVVVLALPYEAGRLGKAAAIELPHRQPDDVDLIHPEKTHPEENGERRG